MRSVGCRDGEGRRRREDARRGARGERGARREREETRETADAASERPAREGLWWGSVTSPDWWMDFRWTSVLEPRRAERSARADGRETDVECEFLNARAGAGVENAVSDALAVQVWSA